MIKSEGPDPPAELGRLVIRVAGEAAEFEPVVDPAPQAEPADQNRESFNGVDEKTASTRRVWNKGKSLSAEHKANISRSMKGKKHSPEHRAKLSRANKGKKHSPKTKAKQSRANKGKKHHSYDQNIDEVRLAIAAHVRGESMSQASRDQGFHEDWLGGWSRNHPERFRMLCRQAVFDSTPSTKPIRQPASGADRSGETKRPWEEEMTREEKIVVLLPRLGLVERQIMVRYWGLEGHPALKAAEINRQLFQGTPIGEAKVRGTIATAETALSST